MVYPIDFSVKYIIINETLCEVQDLIANYVIEAVQLYEHNNLSKFIGAGISTTLTYISPSLCSRLWLELDIIPIVMDLDDDHKKSFWNVKQVDEQADSIARKCIM